MRVLSRSLALFLSFAIALPNPAFALREQPIKEKKPAILAGLEETLLSDNPANGLLQLTELTGATLTAPAGKPIPTPAVDGLQVPLIAAGAEEAGGIPVPKGVRAEVWKEIDRADNLAIEGKYSDVISVIALLRANQQPFSLEETYYLNFSEGQYRINLAIAQQDLKLLEAGISQLEALRASPILSPDLHPEALLDRVAFYSQISFALQTRGQVNSDRQDLQAAIYDVDRALFEMNRDQLTPHQQEVQLRLRDQRTEIEQLLAELSDPRRLGPAAGAEELLVKAGQAISRLRLQAAQPTGQAHILYNEAALAALFFLHLPGAERSIGLSPNIAVVDPARPAALTAIAESAGFPRGDVGLWVFRYVVLYDPQVKGDIKRATRVAETRIAQRLPGATPIHISTLPKALDQFGRRLREILESFGLTFQDGTLDAGAIEALYNASQA